MICCICDEPIDGEYIEDRPGLVASNYHVACWDRTRFEDEPPSSEIPAVVAESTFGEVNVPSKFMP